MQKTMTKTKTKTLIAVALVALSVGGTALAVTIIRRQSGQSGYSIINSSKTKTPKGTSQVAPVCGNGQLEKGEECDDGNKKSGDGCTGCPTGCQTSFNSVNSIFNIDTVSATACTGKFEGCPTTDEWSCISGTCQKSRCGDGVCNDCSMAFSPCSGETNASCASDCKATTPPTPTTDECKKCVGGCRKESVNQISTPTDSVKLDAKNKYYEKIVDAGEIGKYYVILDADVNTITMGIFPRADYDDVNLQMMVSDVSQPDWDTYNQYVKADLEKHKSPLRRKGTAPWYSIMPGGGESLILYSKDINTNMQKGRIFFISVFNPSDRQAKFTVAWNAYASPKPPPSDSVD